jgi:hypothetical protein
VKENIVLPNKVKNNWWLDISLFIGGVIAIFSGIYFLILPVGGFKGGRNPYYGIQILFDRSTWESLHTWGGVAMILVAIVHFIIHWKWVKGTVKLLAGSIFTKSGAPSASNKRNGLVDGIILISFVLSAISGLYFLFAPEARNDTIIRFLFSPIVWDNLHTWSSVVFISAILVHLVLHWKWIAKVTPNIFRRQKKASLSFQFVKISKE